MSLPLPQHQQPQITKLHPDILWIIFILNSHTSWSKDWVIFTDVRDADESETVTSALIDNRSFSQVCSIWRQIILSSPSIWANSLDLKFLCQPDPDGRWRNEILRRTGSDVPLTLVGGISPSVDDYDTQFALSVVENHLHRIRRLLIYTGRGISEEFEKRVYAAMKRPMPHMEYLSLLTRQPGGEITQERVHLQPQPSAVPASTIYPLCLRYLCIWGYQPKLARGSLSSITELHLIDIRSLSMSALFSGLLEMPLLHSLHLEFMRDSGVVLPEDNISGTTVSLPTVTLPYLVDIKIASGVHFMEDFITNIIPSTSSCINFTHCVRNVYPEDSDPIAFQSDLELEQFGTVLYGTPN